VSATGSFSVTEVLVVVVDVDSTSTNADTLVDVTFVYEKYIFLSSSLRAYCTGALLCSQYVAIHLE